jgi:hypothetical protein
MFGLHKMSARNGKQWKSIVIHFKSRQTNTKYISSNVHIVNYSEMFQCIYIIWARDGVVVKALCYKSTGCGFDSHLCHWNFWVTYSFQSRYGPEVDTASNRNEHQVYFLGGKGGRCVRLTTLLPFCAVIMKSGNLNFLEHSGPLLACNGTALPWPLPLQKNT